jgi:hypothetical protein
VKKLIAFLFVFTVVANFDSYAIFPGGPPTPAPVDGGITLLVAAGVYYGLNKMKKQKEEEL